MQNIVLAIFASIELSFETYFFFSVLKRRFSVRTSALVYILYTIFSIVKHLLLYSQMQTRSLIAFSTTLILLFVLFTDSIAKKLACYAVYIISAMLSETIVGTFYKIVLKTNAIKLEITTKEDVVKLTIIYILSFSFLIAAKHLIFKRKTNFRNKTAWYLALYGIVQCGLVYVLFLIVADYKIHSVVVLLSMSFIIIMSTIIAALLYRSLKKSVSDETRAEQMELQLKMQQEHFKQLEQQYDEYKRLRHDYKNHIRILQNISDPDKKHEYIDQLTEKIDKQKGVTFCNNAALDALLFIQYNSALQKGIKTEFLICDLNYCGVSDIDLCTILSNLTDNAIRAALGCESEKFIQVCVTRKLDKLIVSVSNSGKEPTSDYKTTKSNPKEHGLGLDIVRRTAKEYDGSVTLKYENGVFTAAVILDEKLKDNSASTKSSNRSDAVLEL